jgi:methylmalonyl-CoA mutase N-terminal domain/subunit
VLRGIEDGWFQGALADSAYAFEKALGSGERVIVGVNKYASTDEEQLDILRIGSEVEVTQRARIAAVRSGRNEAAAQAALAALTAAAGATDNLMPLLVAAARARATEGEITSALKSVFGGYREPPRL